MKSLKIYAFLAVVLLGLQFEANAQFGLTMTEISNDKYKIEPDKKVQIDAVIPYREGGISALQVMKGMTNSVVEFWDLKNNKKISESENFQGISAIARFTNDNSKYMIYTFAKGGKSMAVKTIEVQTGKTIKTSPVGFGMAISMNFLNDSLMFTCPKYSKVDTALKVMNINTGKVERTYPNIGINGVKQFDNKLVLMYQPDKRIKDFNNSNTSNVIVFDALNGETIIIKNQIFKDNKSKPELCFLENDKLFVIYGGMYPKFIEYNLLTSNSIEWLPKNAQDGFVNSGPGIPYCTSPDGKYLVCDNGMGIQIWDTAKKESVLFMTEDLRITNGLKSPYQNVHFEGKYLVGTIMGFSQVGSDEKDHISYWDFEKLVNK